MVALALGLLAANIVAARAGLRRPSRPRPAREAAKESIGEAGHRLGPRRFITGDLLPTSFLQPFVDNEILQILVLAILTAAAISMLPTAQRERIVARLRGRLAR